MKLIPILLAIVPLLDAQTTYIVTHAASAEAKALFSAKLVKMNAVKIHWYDNTSVVRVAIPPNALPELLSDPDVETVIPDPEQPAIGPETKPISCAAGALPPVSPAPPVPLPPIAPPALPNMPLPMPAGGGGLAPGIGSPMLQPAFGFADALAGGVVQKLLNRPAACKVSMVKHPATYSGQGGEGLIEVNASGSCSWQAQASVGWITILSGSGVSGSGIISYRVAAGDGLARSASIWILPSPGGSPIKGKASQVVTQNK